MNGSANKGEFMKAPPADDCAKGSDCTGETISGKRIRSLRRYVATLTLATSLAVMGGCGAAAKEGKDNSTGTSPKPASSTASTSAASGGSGSQGGLPQGSESVKLEPVDFSINIDNPYWPMSPGTKWVYSETDTKGTKEKVVVEVTAKTKMIANGIEARVIRDTVTENGAPVEITDDWYSQDKAGNIWYLGEYVTNYENGKVVGHGGSFEAGVDGAQPGIAMPANPDPGLSYRQEYYKSESENKASVITIGE